MGYRQGNDTRLVSEKRNTGPVGVAFRNGEAWDSSGISDWFGAWKHIETNGDGIRWVSGILALS